MPTADASDMSDIDPDRFTLRHIDALREAIAQVMEEVEFLRELLVRLPTPREQAFTPLRIMLGTAVVSSAITISLVRSLLAALSLRYRQLKAKPPNLRAAH
jgi:hypothetical protein